MAARLLAMFCLWLALAGTARAFCRTYTQDPAPTTCPDSCKMLGVPLAWQTPNLSYAFNVKGFPGIADADLRRMIAQSMATWEAVTCDGAPIGFSSVPELAPTDLTLGPKSDEPNENVVAYLSPSAWRDYELGSQAYAVTGMWFNKRTGEIIGADMMFNDSMGPFGECPDTGCTSTGPRVDIRNVATHEFGHFLGLAHSEVDASTMYCNAVPREVSKRHLTADDIAGVCDVYPPGQAFVPKPDAGQPSKGNSEGCALGSPASGGWLLLALALTRRRAR